MTQKTTKMRDLKPWHHEAIQLHKIGMSSRKIGRMLGVGKTSVNDLLSKLDGTFYKWKEPELKNLLTGPRILIYDIETAPIIGQLWSLWQDGIGLNQIQADWFIMSFAAKWYGEDEIFYFDQKDAEAMEDDSYLLNQLWLLLDEADIVVGQNVKRFDTKKVNARFIMSDLPRPSVYRQIDTMLIAKANFGFTSNKLEYMLEKLCPEHPKSKHNEYPGHTLWSECLKGNPDAWAVMKSYNIDDVVGTEVLFKKLAAWDMKLPNFDVYIDAVLDMDKWEAAGFVYSQFGKYQNFRHRDTGAQRRGRTNLLSKEKRQSLLANHVG